MSNNRRSLMPPKEWALPIPTLNLMEEFQLEMRGIKLRSFYPGRSAGSSYNNETGTQDWNKNALKRKAADEKCDKANKKAKINREQERLNAEIAERATDEENEEMQGGKRPDRSA